MAGLPMGIICRSKHPGVHEAWMKKSSCSLKIHEVIAGAAQGAALDEEATVGATQ